MRGLLLCSTYGLVALCEMQRLAFGSPGPRAVGGAAMKTGGNLTSRYSGHGGAGASIEDSENIFPPCVYK